MYINLLIAIKNIVNNPISNPKPHSTSLNRINSAGETLELYIKDIFCNSLHIPEQNKKAEIFSNYFSYIGNQNNPPDLIIKNGDAIEIKKIENSHSGIALNSSYPKDKLYSDSSMITKSCKECEDWQEKDLLYAIGFIKNKVLKSLWFVYGDCYAADKETYERIKKKISSGLNDISNIELSETNELGRVNKVDPLGITYLRIRGMWHIENPKKVFDYVYKESESNFTVNALILKNKYDSFPENDKREIEQIKKSGFTIQDVKIKSPNNPAKMLDAKLISFNN